MTVKRNYAPYFHKPSLTWTINRTVSDPDGKLIFATENEARVKIMKDYIAFIKACVNQLRSIVECTK